MGSVVGLSTKSMTFMRGNLNTVKSLALEGSFGELEPGTWGK